MNECCPTCHQPLPATDILFHADAGVVVGRGKCVSLPRREALILEFLFQKKGRFVTKEAVFSAVYTRDDDHIDGPQVVESHISKLKKKIGPLGVKIRSERFRGYQLILEN